MFWVWTECPNISDTLQGDVASNFLYNLCYEQVIFEDSMSLKTQRKLMERGHFPHSCVYQDIQTYLFVPINDLLSFLRSTTTVD